MLPGESATLGQGSRGRFYLPDATMPLHLSLATSGAKKWVLRFLTRGRPRETGLRSYPEVSLVGAREKALAGRRLAQCGVDPIAARNTGEGVPTLGGLADDIPGQLAEGLRNEKHKALTVYAEALRTTPVDKIEGAGVPAALNSFWTEKPKPAWPFRGRTERALNAAQANGDRTDENPAAWGGPVENLLSPKSFRSVAPNPLRPKAYDDVLAASPRQACSTAGKL